MIEFIYLCRQIFHRKKPAFYMTAIYFLFPLSFFKPRGERNIYAFFLLRSGWYFIPLFTWLIFLDFFVSKESSGVCYTCLCFRYANTQGYLSNLIYLKFAFVNILVLCIIELFWFIELFNNYLMIMIELISTIYKNHLLWSINIGLS